MSAETVDAAAAAIVRQAAVLCAAVDAFVALRDDIDEVVGVVPAGVAAAPSDGAAAAVRGGMTQVAARGEFLNKPASIRRGSGLWGRVWLNGTRVEEDGGNATRIGAPLVVAGSVVGIVGVVRPASKAEAEQAGDVALVADLASAALQQLRKRRA
jgi:hypothetical protein